MELFGFELSMPESACSRKNISFRYRSKPCTVKLNDIRTQQTVYQQFYAVFEKIIWKIVGFLLEVLNILYLVAFENRNTRDLLWMLK